MMKSQHHPEAFLLPCWKAVRPAAGSMLMTAEHTLVRKQCTVP